MTSQTRLVPHILQYYCFHDVTIVLAMNVVNRTYLDISLRSFANFEATARCSVDGLTSFAPAILVRNSCLHCVVDFEPLPLPRLNLQSLNRCVEDFVKQAVQSLFRYALDYGTSPGGWPHYVVYSVMLALDSYVLDFVNYQMTPASWARGFEMELLGNYPLIHLPGY